MGQIWRDRDGEKKLVILKLDEAAEWLLTMKIPVIMGEFGTIEPVDIESRI
jgi:hypothetical protein